jgi:hypothetical protein
MKNEAGNRYGRLTVLRPYNSDRLGRNWLCRCDCGQEIVVRGMLLRNGQTRSCGCYRRMTFEQRKNSGLTPHGKEREIVHV